MKEIQKPFIENQNPTGVFSEQYQSSSSTNARLWDTLSTGGHFMDQGTSESRLETYETNNRKGNSNLF